MKVDNPRFDESAGGEVEDCDQCPLEGHSWACYDWHERHNFICPTGMEQYDEACRLAEQATN